MTRTYARMVAALAVAGMIGCASDGAGSDRGTQQDGSSSTPTGAAGNGAPGATTPTPGGTTPNTPVPGGAAPASATPPGSTPSGTDRSGDGSGDGTTGGTDDAASANVDCSLLPLPANFDDVVATFEDGTGATNVVEGRGGGFYMFNDGSGTQMPPTEALPPAEKMNRCDSIYALCTTGSGFTEWGAGMGTDLGPTEGDTKSSYDASDYKGIAFWAKIASGTTGAVRVSLKDANTAPEGGVCDEAESSGDTACNDDWGKALNVTSEWQPYTIMFDELRQSGWGATYDAFEQTAVYSIQFQFGPNLDFDFCIDDLQLVR